MKRTKANFKNWHIQCIPEDGARISVLKYLGHDLLTANPLVFKSPEKFYGDYETRPVYGYDDCFPSVDPCIYFENKFKCRDHGNLCWQEWKLQTKGNNIICSTDCLQTSVTFKRMMVFDGNKLTWKFEVKNRTSENLAFLHVMHALLPLKSIQSIILPEFGNALDEINSVESGFKKAHEVAENLLTSKSGECKMLILREVKDGTIKLGIQEGMILNISFDIKLFPSIGIWWNNASFPNEAGLQRTECAFEPIPGTCSDLSKSFKDGTYLSVENGKALSWEIIWSIEHYNKKNNL